jgi:uncharacterized protein YeaO (DUF488 family)
MEKNELSAIMREWQRQLEPSREISKQFSDLKIVVDSSAIQLALADSVRIVTEFRERYSDIITEFQERYKETVLKCVCPT